MLAPPGRQAGHGITSPPLLVRLPSHTLHEVRLVRLPQALHQRQPPPPRQRPVWLAASASPMRHFQAGILAAGPFGTMRVAAQAANPPAATPKSPPLHLTLPPSPSGTKRGTVPQLAATTGPLPRAVRVPTSAPAAGGGDAGAARDAGAANKGVGLDEAVREAKAAAAAEHVAANPPPYGDLRVTWGLGGPLFELWWREYASPSAQALFDSALKGGESIGSAQRIHLAMYAHLLCVFEHTFAEPREYSLEDAAGPSKGVEVYDWRVGPTTLAALPAVLACSPVAIKLYHPLAKRTLLLSRYMFPCLYFWVIASPHALQCIASAASATPPAVICNSVTVHWGTCSVPHLPASTRQRSRPSLRPLSLAPTCLPC